jgi:hypothetical protein
LLKIESEITESFCVPIIIVKPSLYNCIPVKYGPIEKRLKKNPESTILLFNGRKSKEPAAIIYDHISVMKFLSSRFYGIVYYRQ